MAAAKRDTDGSLRRLAACGAAMSVALLLGAAALAKPQEVSPQPPAIDATPNAEGNLVAPDEATPGGAEVFFNAETWRALVEGKTLYYQTPQGMVGREYYPPGSNRAVFEYAGDNSCFEGSWTEQDGKFCFNYDGTHCFYHLMRDGEIFARQMDGVDQKVIKITKEPFTCGAELTS